MAQLSSRYATALFELSIERGVLQDNLEQAVFLRDTLMEAQCKKIITHPRITAKEKHVFLNGAFSGRINTDLLGFLHLAVEKRRESIIGPVLTDFITMANDYSRRTTALVISAVLLRDDQQARLAELLSRKLDKQVTIKQKVDPSVMGGLYIQVDGYYIDRTLKNRLHEMKLSMSV